MAKVWLEASGGDRKREEEEAIVLSAEVHLSGPRAGHRDGSWRAGGWQCRLQRHQPASKGPDDDTLFGAAQTAARLLGLRWPRISGDRPVQ